MVRLTMFLGAVALAAATAVPGPAAAQSDSAAQSLIDRLRPSAGSGSRGIRVQSETATPSTPAAPAPVWRAAPAAAVPAPQAAARPTAAPPAQPRETTANAPSVSITVTFASGSATLTPEAERALAPLGRALASPELAPYRFRIEGHTDTVGDAAVNQSLSERRAAAVREHLSRVYNVDAGRLVAIGFGSSQLLVQTPPQVADPRNRRVQVVNIGN
jgi:outer membrane protein OmpA-like peptidoglycan-associated protein